MRKKICTYQERGCILKLSEERAASYNRSGEFLENILNSYFFLMHIERTTGTCGLK